MSKLIFRKIHGRIVPIKVKAESDNNTVKGAALVGGGAGVATLTGKVAAGLTHDAANAENAARKSLSASRKFVKTSKGLGPLFEVAAEPARLKAGEQALKTMVESRKLFAASTNIRKFGFGAASALIGLGVHKALKDTEVKDNPKTRAAVATGAAVASHFIIRTAYLKGLKIPVVKAAISAAKTIILKGVK